MGHSLGDALIVTALCAVWIAYLYFKHRERQRRAEVLHQERVAAMEKGIPLPELPVEPLKPPADPREPLLHGIVWLAFGLGGVAALLTIGPVRNMPALWPFALPLVFLGVGLILYYILAARTR